MYVTANSNPEHTGLEFEIQITADNFTIIVNNSFPDKKSLY